MEDTCPSCGGKVDVASDRKILVQSQDSPLGSIVTSMSELKQYDVLLCPRCSFEFSSDKVRMFGVFRRRSYWVPFAILALGFFAVVWYLNVG